MFERFAHEAREAVVQGQVVARAMGAERFGAEHVLVGAARGHDSIAARALSRLGVDADQVESAVRGLPAEHLDAGALAALGIDLDAVRAQAEARFGPGALDGVRPQASSRRRPRSHLPFDAGGRKTLETALREAVRLRHNRIDTGHVLLAIVRLDDLPAARVLESLGLAPGDVDDAVTAAWADSPAA